ncbi:MAG TPA: DUF3106 domain-containing protein [Terracidiphilus sp.]|nr:DUF3106 domain-containing protein [Terracidiphilus sp.]
MKGATNAGSANKARKAIFAIALAVLTCLPAGIVLGQRPNAPRPALNSRTGSMRAEPNRNQFRPQPQSRPRAFGGVAPQSSPYRNFAPQTGYRSVPQNPSAGVHPAFPGQTYQGQGYARPGYPGVGGSYAPPGHLGAWLDAHRGVATQDQQRMLRNDPSFNRLPEGQQQRLMQQLNRVDQMPEAQRERRLARAENLERLSPQQRAQVQDSTRRWRTMPVDRQTAMKSAFQDLRNVPPDQRQTVLGSARYQNAFSPDERGILNNMLSVEPYQPPR